MQRDTLRQIWKLLQQVESEIQRDLLSAEGFRQFQLTELLRGIERYIAAFDDRATAALRAGLEQSFRFGGAYVVDPLDAIGVGVGFFEPTPAMMNVIVEASADLVTGISEPLLRFVNLQVRQVALQQIAPIDAMRNISNNIGFVSMRPGRETVKGIAYNAERIIRTETGRAFNLASHSQQLAVAERVPGMLKRWVASGDARTRETHLAAHMRYLGNPIPVSEPFHVGGSLLMYPGDPNGAPSEIINCLLPDNKVAAPGLEAASRVLYSGPAIELTTASKKRLTVTPNHPILTLEGFVGAQFLDEGDSVVTGRSSQEIARAIDSDYEDTPTSIEEVWGALYMLPIDGVKFDFTPTALDFHGDAGFFYGDVDVVGADSTLRGQVVDSRIPKHLDKNALGRALVLQGPLSRNGPARKFVLAALHSANSVMRALRKLLSLLLGEGLHAYGVRFARASGLDSMLNHARPECRSGNSRQLGKGLHGLPGEMPFNKLINVRNVLPAALSEGSDMGNPFRGIHNKLIGLARSPYLDTGGDKAAPDGGARYRILAGDALKRLAGFVQADTIINVRRFQFTGHVYDLQTSYSYYTANSFIVKNCRCTSVSIHPRVGVLDTPLDARISDELGRRREALLGALLLLHQRPSLDARLAVRVIEGRLNMVEAAIRIVV